MQIMSVPALAAWILVYFLNGNMAIFFVARFLQGFLIMTSGWQVLNGHFKQLSSVTKELRLW